MVDYTILIESLFQHHKFFAAVHPAGTTQRAGDSVIEIEESLIAGVHDHVDGFRIMAMEY